MFTEKTNEIVQRLKKLMGEKTIEINSPRKRRIFLSVEKNSFREAIKKIVNEMRITHLSTITGTDLGQEIELLYHFEYEGSTILTIRTKISKEDPKVHTITDVIPGAVLYERELHEILGVDFEGHPDLAPLILPETWPEHIYPLRKDQKFEDLRKISYKNP